MISKKSRSSNGVLNAFFVLLALTSIAATSFLWQRKQVHIASILVVDTSKSMRESGDFDRVIDIACSEIKEHTATGDTFALQSFAASTSVLHAVKIENRLDGLSLCKDINALLEQGKVDNQIGTSLHGALERLHNQQAHAKQSNTRGTVITILVHADDQGVGSQAIPLEQTLESAERLLNENTQLVLIAIDNQLQQKLVETIQHPQVRISALSDGSIRNSINSAYQSARNGGG
ncbi:hypothetical protein Pse7367_3783 (plasmid) [Thalassoporum mexicanum PCC 7367]|uniref:vWA domain-containing protein n=1 Tax=Thalassoporum mexicanum TaxID=3457544 RepID=UPI00029FAF18|nr:vWA domain-containing protein [Pseudanabaena sp. PCC 7367]AFY72007.1 hypothetical protein Pse7367_3783 [Pseudanabaena sp. PCC 7367]